MKIEKNNSPGTAPDQAGVIDAHHGIAIAVDILFASVERQIKARR